MLASQQISSAPQAQVVAPASVRRAAAIALVVVVELGLMALFVLGWVSAEPAPDAPLPAPAPAALGDFPEQASPSGGCTAVLTISSAIDNGRSERAAAITSRLLEDACLG
jgi:hypothetical protein